VELNVNRLLFALIIASVTAVPLWAQTTDDADDNRNELGLTIGGEVVPDIESNSTRLTFGSSVIFAVNYARRIKTTKNTALFLEFPAFAAPSHSVTNASAAVPATPVSLATFYVTPAFRLNFKTGSRVSPWLSVGGGYGLYEGSERLSNGAVNPDRFSSVGTLQWGGGFDVKTPVKIIFPINLRFEVRDFYTLDSLNFNTGRGTDQHNVNVAGGLLLRW
jgi:hypothetical protein